MNAVSVLFDFFQIYALGLLAENHVESDAESKHDNAPVYYGVGDADYCENS